MYKLLDKSLVELNINGETMSAAIRPADTLLYVLRNELGLLGTKNGCENFFTTILLYAPRTILLIFFKS